MNPVKRLFPLIAGALLAGTACAGDCPADTAPQLVAAQFTSQVRAQAPQDRLLYLSPGAREVYVHATTRGTGTITWRWFRDGKRVADVSARVGDPAATAGATANEWHAWSRLRLSPPVPNDIRVQILGPGDCLLRELTLASTAFVDEAHIRQALAALAAGDATGAKIALNTLLEDTPPPAVARTARRLLDTDVAIARAHAQAEGNELFLVEASLRDVERKLGDTAVDRSLRERIADVRRVAADTRTRIRREDALVALATRNLLETEKLFSGDYPLLREDTERLVTPALAYAGGEFTLADWKPTLRGYRLVLQDKRTGEAFDVTPD